MPLVTVAYATSRNEVPCFVFQNVAPRYDMVRVRGSACLLTTVEAPVI